MRFPAFLSDEQKTQFQRDAEVRKTNWLHAVHELFDEVKGWIAAHPDWQLETSETEIDEEALGGKYDVPVLEIAAPHGRLVLEPIARAVLGAQGRVDFYAWPSLFRVMLLRQTDETWTIRTDSGINWPFPWNQETFFSLAAALTRSS